MVSSSSGVRLLRQEPTECLFSFICTSNNHISRITGMVERLCQALGAPLDQLDRTTYYDFPSLSALAGKFLFSRTPSGIPFEPTLNRPAVTCRRRRRDPAQGPRVWIQGSVPAAERQENSGLLRNPVAGGIAQRPVPGGPRRSAYSSWCWHQGTDQTGLKPTQEPIQVSAVDLTHAASHT